MRPAWRNTLLVVAALLASLLGAAALVAWLSMREWVLPLTSLGGSGQAGRALVVYQPGPSDWPDRVAWAFAHGLVASGWRVDQTSASRQAVADLAGYDLLVLASPVHGAAPAPALTRYLRRLGDLDGQPVVLVFSAVADAGPALEAGAAQVAAQRGRLVGRFGYAAWRPGAAPRSPAAVSEGDLAVSLARDAGQGLRVGYLDMDQGR